MPNRKTAQEYNSAIHNLLNTDPDSFLTTATQNKKEAEHHLLTILVEQRDKVAPTTLKTRLASLKSWMIYEDTPLNWAKIRKAIPQCRMVGNDRPITKKEVRQLLETANRRMKAILLVMAASGIRVGSFPHLSLHDYKHLPEGVGHLVIYRGEREEYWTLLTPEACDAVEAYLDERRRSGEDLTPNSPLIRNALNFGEQNTKPIRISISAIHSDIYNHYIRSGLKRRGDGRGEIKPAHAFRKFFKTTCERTMKSLNVELLMGHATGLNASYYKPLEPEIIGDYLKAVPDLTISEAEEVRRAAKTEDTSKTEQIKLLIERNEEMIQQMQQYKTLFKQDHDLWNQLINKVEEKAKTG